MRVNCIFMALVQVTFINFLLVITILIVSLPHIQAYRRGGNHGGYFRQEVLATNSSNWSNAGM